MNQRKSWLWATRLKESKQFWGFLGTLTRTPLLHPKLHPAIQTIPHDTSFTRKRRRRALRVPQTHPEVLGIHVQLITVQLTQLSKGALEVVEMLQTLTKGLKYLLAMGLHLRVAHNSISSGQVPKVLKEPLSPGVDNQQPKGWKGQKVRETQQLSESQGTALSSQAQVPFTLLKPVLEAGYLPAQGLSTNFIHFHLAK